MIILLLIHSNYTHHKDEFVEANAFSLEMYLTQTQNTIPWMYVNLSLARCP